MHRDPPSHAHTLTPPAPQAMSARDTDWRAGAVVYQVFVDRFAPSADLDAKRALYPAPKTLKDWRLFPRPIARLLWPVATIRLAQVISPFSSTR